MRSQISWVSGYDLSTFQQFELQRMRLMSYVGLYQTS